MPPKKFKKEEPIHLAPKFRAGQVVEYIANGLTPDNPQDYKNLRYGRIESIHFSAEWEESAAGVTERIYHMYHGGSGVDESQILRVVEECLS